MKVCRLLSLALFLFSVLFFLSCKKEGPIGPEGPAGPDAKTFNFNLTFNPGDTYKSYDGIIGFDTDDVLLVYVKYAEYGGTPYWVQTPIIVNGEVNIFAEFSNDSGHIFVNSEYADGSVGSPWTASNTFAFRAVLIKSSQIKANPDLDLTSYEAVSDRFGLVD